MSQEKSSDPQIVQLPTISSIHQPQSSSSSGSLLPSNSSDMILNATSNLPQPDPPYLALTAQQRDLQKLLMASIKRKVSNKNEEIDVREAFGLKRTITKTPSTPASQTSKSVPYSKAAEEAIIAGAIKSEKLSHNDGPILGTYQIPPQNSAPNKSKSNSDAKPAKEKPKSKPKTTKKEVKEESKTQSKEKSKAPKDKEELARMSKEKEEKNALRLKQLNHELQAWKYRSFFLQEAKPVHLMRKRCFRDNLLQEVQWMAIDFRQERRWKLAMQQTIATTCVDRVNERLLSQFKRSEEETLPLKAICKSLSSFVEQFWRQFAPSPRPSPEDFRAESFVGYSQRFLYEVIDEALPSLVERLHTRRQVFELDIPLSPKRAEALQRIGLINSIGYGAVLCGAPHAGKTTLCARLLREWTRKATENGTLQGRFSVVVVPWFAVSLWQYKLHMLGMHVSLWQCYSKPTWEPHVILLSYKDVSNFIAHLRTFESSPLLGVVADCRECVVELVKSNANDDIVKGHKKSEESYSWMRLFFSSISSALDNRCLIVDDLETCAADRNLLLSALIPFFHSHKQSPTPHRRCLDFMERLKVNLSVEESTKVLFNGLKEFALIILAG